jgi:hypothetical protein
MATHEGKIMAATCRIHKSTLESGEIRLYRVIDETGASASYIDELQDFTNVHEDEEPLDMPTTITMKGMKVGGGKENTQQQLHTMFSPASSLLRTSDDSPLSFRKLSTASAPTQVQEPSSNVRPVTLENTPPCSQPKSTPFADTPPCTQRSVSYHAVRPVSGQSTESFDVTSVSSSSSSPFSFSSPSPSSVVVSNEIGKEDQDALDRILAAVVDMMDECRICWLDRVVTRPHRTYRCSKKTLSNREWELFKGDLRFPNGVLCYFCLATYGPPFNHVRAPVGVKQTHELCDYPDALKEVVFILYKDISLRQRVFSKLGVTMPSNLYLYKRYITKPSDGGLLGVYKVLDAYLHVREEERLLA